MTNHYDKFNHNSVAYLAHLVVVALYQNQMNCFFELTFGTAFTRLLTIFFSVSKKMCKTSYFFIVFSGNHTVLRYQKCIFSHEKHKN